MFKSSTYHAPDSKSTSSKRVSSIDTFCDMSVDFRIHLRVHFSVQKSLISRRQNQLPYGNLKLHVKLTVENSFPIPLT